MMWLLNAADDVEKEALAAQLAATVIQLVVESYVAALRLRDG
jgi:hypothetical protein